MEEFITIVAERGEEKEILEDLWKDGLMKVGIKGGQNRLFGGPWS